MPKIIVFHINNGVIVFDLKHCSKISQPASQTGIYINIITGMFKVFFRALCVSKQPVVFQSKGGVSVRGDGQDLCKVSNSARSCPRLVCNLQRVMQV